MYQESHISASIWYFHFPGFLNAEISAPVAVASSDEVKSFYTFTFNHKISWKKIDKDELAKRTAYLKQQRDKLLAMKKAEREKQLADAEASHGSSRPKVTWMKKANID